MVVYEGNRYLRDRKGVRMSGKPTERRTSALETLKQELLDDHWRHCYSWKGLSPVKIAAQQGCSPDDVRSLMFEIQKTHPKPKGNSYGKGTCKYCGAAVVWIGEYICDPPVLKGITADGRWHSFRQSHFATCPRANQARKSS